MKADQSQWLKASSNLTRAANTFARRNDLIARIYPREGTRSPAPAWFTPRHATIDIDPAKIDLLVSDPEQINLDTRRDRRRFATLTGLVSHEAAHAAHTVLKFPKNCTQEEIHWAVILEEPRIEYRALTDSNPSVRPFLRASARYLVAQGIDDQVTSDRFLFTSGFVRAMVLILGRNVATVLTDSDVARLRALAQERLGENFDKIMDVITRAVHLGDNLLDDLIALARELAALVEEATPEEEKEAIEKAKRAFQRAVQQAVEQAVGQGGKGSPSQGNGTAVAVRMPCGSLSHDDGRDASEEAPNAESSNDGAGEDPVSNEVMDAIKEALDAARDGALADLSTEARNGAINSPSREHRESVARRKEARQVAEEVFGKTRGVSMAGVGARWTMSITEMAPDPDSINQARRMTVALRRAQFRETSRALVRSQTPPGRMNMRELTRRQSQVDTNMEITAVPWSRLRRRVNNVPPIYLGVSVDASASMNAYQRPASSLAWAVAQATRHLPGRVASVAWNSKPVALTVPGRVSNTVPVARASGTSEGCPASLLALQGALDMYPDTDGIKVIIVVTDADLPNRREVEDRVESLLRQDVYTIWVTVKTMRSHSTFVPPAAAIHVPLQNASEYGDKVGEALCRLALQVGRSLGGSR